MKIRRVIMQLQPLVLIKAVLLILTMPVKGGEVESMQKGVSDLRAVYFHDKKNGWIAGRGGELLHTEDGGDSWQTQFTGNGRDVLGIYFLDEYRGWLVGQQGKIYHTQDGGTSWESQEGASGRWLYSVYFVDSQTGWAAGERGTILKTNNGGEDWQEIETGTDMYFRSLHFIDKNTGWVVGQDGTILNTSDGGESWTNQTSSKKPSLESVYFTDSQHGWVVGMAGAIYHTTDGGETWKSQESDVLAPLYGVTFTDNSSGYITGGGGTILSTENGGKAWTREETDVTSDLRALNYTGEEVLWIVGNEGVMLQLSEFNGEWKKRGGGNDLFDIYFVNSSEAKVVGSHGTFLRSETGGSTWSEETEIEVYERLTSIDFFNETRGLIGGTHGKTLNTTSGGKNWETNRISTSEINDVQVVDGKKWAAGGNASNGKIFHNSDLTGNSWKLQDSTSSKFWSLHFANENTGWAVGDEGKIYHTSDGENWVSQISGSEVRLRSVYFSNHFDGWAVGDHGTILHTMDGGLNWNPQVSPVKSVLYSVKFLDSQTGIIVGKDGTMLRTLNGGNDWEEIESGTTMDLLSLDYKTEESAWIVGENGLILQYTEDYTTPAVELELPMNRSEITVLNPTLSWRSAKENEEYKVEVAREGDFSDPIISVTTPEEQHEISEALELNTTYHWRVKPKGKEEIWSVTWRFTTEESTSVSEDSETIEKHFKNRPNPFTNRTKLEYKLAEPGHVKLDIVDVRGKTWDILVDEYQSKGHHEVIIEDEGLSPGIYLARIVTQDGQSAIRRIVKSE